MTTTKHRLTFTEHQLRLIHLALCDSLGDVPDPSEVETNRILDMIDRALARGETLRTQ